MKPTKYNTIMPRIALESLKLIDLNEIVRLIGNNLDDIFNFLANTTYREEIISTCGDLIEPGLLEEALFQNYAKMYKKLLNNSSKYIKNLLKSILHKFDALNLKTMLRMVQAGMNAEDILQHIIPLGMYDRKKCQVILTEARSINDIVDSLQKQDFGFFLKEFIQSQWSLSDLSPLEAVLNKEVFKGILKEIKNLNRQDKKIATNILGIEIDALNVKTTLKYKELITNYKTLKENLMPVVEIDEEVLESAIREPNIKSTLQCFLSSVEKKHPVYQAIFTKLVEESDSPISRLEFILEKAPLAMSFFELKKNMRYYNIGYILAFLNIKWVEIKNLICIINAIARNVDANQIHDLLILPENY